MKTCKTEQKVTVWDYLFQIVILITGVVLAPAITIIIDYKEFSWIMAGINFTWIMIMFYLVHRYQVRHGILKEKNDEDK